MSKRQKKIYKFYDFATKQEKAVQWFLHYSYDHRDAAKILRTEDPRFLDTSAYLINLAFELLLKGIHISEKGEYEGIHDLIPLYEGLEKIKLTKKEVELLKVIDKYNFVRYPIDQPLDKKQSILNLNGETFYLNEVDTRILQEAEGLFDKVWKKLSGVKGYKSIIKKICEDPYNKGGRRILKKRIN